jgi:heme-degrading monooxygenase HmoA
VLGAIRVTSDVHMTSKVTCDPGTVGSAGVVTRGAGRAGKVESAEGFEAFQLLRPNDDRDVCLVVTQWRSEEDFPAWMRSADFAAGHAQHRASGPVGTASEVWSFELLETKAAEQT